MAFKLPDRTYETTTTTGTGTVSLLGAVTGYQSFSAGVGNSNTTYYCIQGQSGAEWEVGIGTYTSSGSTLSRTTVIASSNSNALVTFSAGTKNVFVSAPGEKIIYGDNNGLVDASLFTGAFQPPIGTTAQRPSSPTNGSSRWNTSVNTYEIFNGVAWISLVALGIPVSYVLVAGGGGGAGAEGGGGAGGVLTGISALSSGTTYSFIVGGGGVGGAWGANGTAGTNTTGFGIAAVGGGYGTHNGDGGSGGSGGGGGFSGVGGASSAGQGNIGGGGYNGGNYCGGGGGGANSTGGTATITVAGNGGDGLGTAITGTTTYYGGGGGGCSRSTADTQGTGGAGGGGAGVCGGNGTNGTINTGGGAGAGTSNGGGANNGGTGGSGVMIISVPTAFYTGNYTGSPTITTSGTNTVIKYTSSGSYVA